MHLSDGIIEMSYLSHSDSLQEQNHPAMAHNTGDWAEYNAEYLLHELQLVFEMLNMKDLLSEMWRTTFELGLHFPL